MIALGFSLRRFESERREATGTFADDLDASLGDAENRGAEARLIAEELAGPRRHKRLIAARLADQAAATAGGEAGLPISGAPDPPIEAPHSATPDVPDDLRPGGGNLARARILGARDWAPRGAGAERGRSSTRRV